MAYTISFFPFDDGPGSNAEEIQWQDMMEHMRTSGIIAATTTLGGMDDCAVAPDFDMQIQVYEGKAWIKGFMFLHTGDPFPLLIADSDMTDDRIDLVTLRLNTDDNIIEYHVEEGVAAPVPVAPTPVHVLPIWDIPLAEVYVPANATAITMMDITDVRERSVQGSGGSTPLVAGMGITLTHSGNSIIISSP